MRSAYLCSSYDRPVSIRIWRPLSARLAGKPVISIVTTAPADALEMKLREWLKEALELEDEETIHRLAVRLNKPDAFEEAEYLYDESWVDWDELYDVIDAALDLGVGDWRALDELLDDGLSAYTVATGSRGLVTRADPIDTAALTVAIDEAKSRNDVGSASEHLAAAWAAAYAKQPDPVKAYSESIKAVEAAAHATIHPGNSRATLGTMLKYMRDHEGDFRVMIPAPGVPVAGLIGMMAILWQGQTSRHGGQAPTRAETPAEARAAMQLAVTLVHWFSTGIVRRTPAPSS